MRSPITQKQVYTLHPEKTLPTANFLSAFAQRDPSIPWQITMEPYKKNRTRAQNSIMWAWHTLWAEEFGYTKELAHEKFKYRHVLPILLRDDDEGKLTELHAVAKTEKRMMAALVNILSTTHLSTAQFTEALDEYDRVTAARGLAFPKPEEQYQEAMGK